MRELVEIIIIGRPAVTSRITRLMIAYRGHDRYLAEELRTGSEEIVIPIAVIAFAGNEVAIHEGDVAIEIANKVLAITPVTTGVAMDITDREDTESRTCFGSRLGP